MVQRLGPSQIGISAQRKPMGLGAFSFGAIVALLLLSGCAKHVEPFSVAHVDQTISAPTAFPPASNPDLVGTHPGPAKSGAGYFYDDVLEYRVWMHPERGAAKLAGDDDYFAAFAHFEPALAYSKSSKGAEPPLVLVRQVEYINEPEPGVFEWTKSQRVTEWQVEWLKGNRRTPESIPNFLAKHQVAKRPPSTLDQP